MSVPGPVQRPSRIPAGATAQGDAIAVGDGRVPVDAWIDFQCPFCCRFEMRSGPALKQLIARGLIEMDYHPVAFLDRVSTTAYSTRASASSGCAADGGRFEAYKDALFAHQPPEGGPGLSDEQLIAIGRTVGLDDPGFVSCVDEHTHLEWTRFVTARAIELGIGGTPTVMVAGVPVQADAAAIAAAVAGIRQPSRPRV
jgi:protein-disulfide isomerase